MDALQGDCHILGSRPAKDCDDAAASPPTREGAAFKVSRKSIARIHRPFARPPEPWIARLAYASTVH